MYILAVHILHRYLQEPALLPEAVESVLRGPGLLQPDPGFFAGAVRVPGRIQTQNIPGISVLRLRVCTGIFFQFQIEANLNKINVQ